MRVCARSASAHHHVALREGGGSLATRATKRHNNFSGVKETVGIAATTPTTTTMCKCNLFIHADFSGSRSLHSAGLNKAHRAAPVSVCPLRALICSSYVAPYSPKESQELTYLHASEACTRAQMGVIKIIIWNALKSHLNGVKCL